MKRCGVSFLPGLLAAALITVLVGCETVGNVPTEDIYQAPSAGSSMATLRGSKLTEGGLFGSEHRGFVIMVDLKSIPDAAGRWDTPLALAPGRRAIAAEYRYSNFVSRAYLPLDAKAGAAYQLMIKNGREKTADGRLFSDFWIVDLATGQPVTPIHHRQVTGGKKGTIFYENK